MEHDELIGQVQARARLASRGDAERATRAALETLAERIPAGTATSLGAQLPHEIGEHLRRSGDDSASGERFDYDEFLDRVTEREGVDRPEAVFHARVVFEVVDEATTGDLMGKVCESLPTDLQRLVTAGSTGDLRSG